MAAERLQQADDLGPVVAWTGLLEGTPVYDPDGRPVGVVERVEAPLGIFEGIVIHTRPLPGRHRFAGHDQIAELRERGVKLAVDRAEVHELGEHDGRRRRDSERPEPAVEALLRKAWDWLSGVR